ncbi:hypothetical protein DHEL01_v206172 [Diaporthe helianthi]|uniref:Major facilitator superfamily (MFS) profile domain-containing protein n=1 Tax=Diaporthe helianthi TaxID=158607 RepID=A0A2P5HYU6_DIAHE|nr:hypothetical protein DHEL01_v206172 [Diaporthe helianthi]
MAGMSISPFVAGLFGNFTVSFLLALGLFALSAIYLRFCFCNSDIQISNTSSEQSEVRECLSERIPISGTFLGLSRTFCAVLSPLEPFREDPCHLLIGLSLLIYNVVQSYVFNALLIYATVRFGFTGKENGYIISITHSIAGVYLFALLFLPRHVKRCLENRNCVHSVNTVFSTQSKDTILGLVSLSIQTFALVALSRASQARDIYITTLLLAAGLPAPSFIKGYFVGNFDTRRGPAALGALATMETLGSVLGPLLLGGLQSHFGVNGSVFLTASGMTATSLVLFTLGCTLKRRRRS